MNVKQLDSKMVSGLPRRSGKTLRALCRVIEHASEDKEARVVAYVAPTRDRAKYGLDRAAAMLSHVDIKWEPQHSKITLANGTRILFMSIDEWEQQRGVRIKHVEFDGD